MELGDDNDYCHLAVRPTDEALGRGQNTIMIGTTFLENYYIFLLATDIVNTVGITEANPENVILDAHYNPRASNTEWLPEARETDKSEYYGDWTDPY